MNHRICISHDGGTGWQPSIQATQGGNHETGQLENRVESAFARLLSFPFGGQSHRRSAQNMADYTNYPIFLNQTVPPNILFVVDMGNYTLEAAYSGSNQRYWISLKPER